MTSVDSTANINRILAILSNDTPLAAIIRTFQFGEDNYEVHDGNFPYLLVTTPNTPIITKDAFGVGDGDNDPATLVQYVIKMFVLGSDAKSAETELYDIIKKVIDILRANSRLKEPVADNDPKCIRSVLFPGTFTPNSRGKENQGFEITIQCQIGEAIGLVYDGVTISVLEEVNSPHGWNITNSPDDTGLIDAAPIILEEKKFFKIETSPTLQSTLRGKIRSPGYKAATITKSGTARAISLSMLTRISDLILYDQIPQAVIELQIIKDTS